jgi:uncharacterized protein (DUF608 family)
MRIALSLGLAATIAAGLCSADFDPATGTITNERWRSGVPLGGIGCGAVELLTDGSMGNVTINHNWDRPTGVLRGGFAAVRVRSGGAASARLLRLTGDGDYANARGVQNTSYLGLYPRAEMTFSDPDLPAGIKLHAYSPLIPRDAANSSLPVAFLDFTLSNPGSQEAEVAVAVSFENLLGFGGRRDVSWDAVEGNRQRPEGIGPWSGLLFATTQSYEDLRQNTVGTYFLGAESSEAVSVTCCPAWDPAAKSVAFWEQFSGTGALSALGSPPATGRAAGAVCARTTVPAGGEAQLRFLLAWDMPTFRMARQASAPTGRFVERKDAGRAAIDGDINTRWGTGRGQKAGDRFVLHLSRPAEVRGLVLDSTPSVNDYPRGYLVEGSVDDKSWTELARATPVEAAGAQERGKLTIDLRPAEVRHLRITGGGSENTWWWSIHELALTGPEGTVDLSGATVSDRLVEVAVQSVQTDIGHYHSSALPNIESIARYAAGHRESLLAGTRLWQDEVMRSNLPFWLKLKLINCAFTMYSATVLAKDGRFAVMESPIDMDGALGTMDQRMAAHAFYTQLFPSLDRNELESFARCQQDDGRITHFNGNFHEVLGDPNVGYGVTDWPDLSASWVLQVLKLYRWTGDAELLRAMWPHIQRAMAWLQSADQDGDLIPEGGSTYDYEALPRGAFVYSASCYLGALLAAHAAAEAMDDADSANAYSERFYAVRRATMERLWNGEFFRKWRSGKAEAENPNSFVAALAGDWLAHLSGLPTTLPGDTARRQVEQLIARHLNPFFPVPPMEVTPDGEAATAACYLLQHEPYLGCEAIYQGYTDAGLEVLRRVYHCAWEQNRSPWDQSLSYSAPGGAQGGLRSYMTCPTTWHVLNALTGVTLDLPAKTLYVSPRLPSDAASLDVPVFLGTFWATMMYNPSQSVLQLEITRTFEDTDCEFTHVARDGNRARIALPQTFRVQEGAVLDLSGHIEELAPFSRSREVKWQVKPPVGPRRGLPPEGWRLDAYVPDAAPTTEMNLKLAIDEDLTTRWTTGRGMRPGDRFQVDLGESRRIQGVWADIAQSGRDYPRGYTIEVSPDGENWRRVAKADEATSRRCVIHGLWRADFAPVEARYIRITQKGSHDRWWWSMHELYVLPEGYREPPREGLLNVERKRGAARK